MTRDRGIPQSGLDKEIISLQGQGMFEILIQ